jgi:hypothetical protein
MILVRSIRSSSDVEFYTSFFGPDYYLCRCRVCNCGGVITVCDPTLENLLAAWEALEHSHSDNV